MFGSVGFIALVILSVLSLLFFSRWRMEARGRRSLKFQLDIKEMVINSANGGYYFWNAEAGEEDISVNLERVLGIKAYIKNFAELAGYFGADKKTLLELFGRLKNGEQDHFVINCRHKSEDGYKNIQCVGNRVDDNRGGVGGLIIWFYDVSEFMEQIKKLTSYSGRIKNEARDYANIFNSVPIPVWWRNKDFSVRRANVAYSQVVNDNAVEPEGQKVAELDEGLQRMSQIAARNRRELVVKKHMVVEGERRFYQIVERVVGNGEGVIGFAVDISSQEDIEKELQRHISAHADLLESSSSAMAIYGPDTRLKFYNQAFVKLWLLDEKWLNGNPTYSEVLEHLREERKLPEQADFRSFRNEQMKLFNDLIDPHDEFFYLPDGKALRVIVIPHALGGLLFAYEDMTDKFAMERSYNTLIAVQRETLDHLREAVAVFSHNGELRLYNPKYVEMWPYEAPILERKPRNVELLELSKHMFDYGDDWEEFVAEWTQPPTTKAPVVQRFERTDGMVIDKLIVPLPNGDYLLSYQDVTDTIRAEESLRERNEALEEADRLKTEFLANVSYELRTPLTSIMGFSEVLEEKHFGELNKRQMEYVHGIRDSSNQLMTLISDILDLASIEAGYMTLDARPFNIFDMLVALMHLVQARCITAGISITLQCDQTIGEMLGDEKRIKQIMFNIIGNSMKFTEKGGSVVVGCEENAKGEIMFWVDDTGIGIPKRDKKKVFDRFYKSSGISAQKSGTGLGLSVVKNIVELHGGRIKIESVEGEGTRVMCFFKRENKKLLG